MGCASSNPLVEGGKNIIDNAKESTDNVIAMGEKAMQDAGDAVTTGVDNLKNSLESGLQTAQDSIGSVVNNLENTIGLTKNKAEDMVDTATGRMEEVSEAVASEVMEEVSSDTKTVLAFEGATTTEIMDRAEALKDEFGETVEQMENKIEETLHIEEIDDVANNSRVPDGSDAMDSNNAPPVIDEPPDGVKEQTRVRPTPWEAAADAILAVGMMARKGSQRRNDGENNGDITTEIFDISKLESKQDNNGSDILLSDTLSIKSYKSEI